MPETRHHRLATLGLVYAAAIWGSTFVLVKDSLEHIHPVTLVGYRFLLAGLALGAWLVWRRQPLWAGWRHGVGLGVLLWLLYGPQTIGLGYTTASNSAFITGLFVAFVPLLGWLVFRRRPGRGDWGVVALALLGLWLLTGGLRAANAGDLLTLLTAVAFAAHILAIDHALQAGHDPLVLNVQQFLTVGAISIALAAGLDLPLDVRGANTWGVIFFLAFLPTLSAFGIQLWAQKRVAPLRVSLILTLEPVFAALFAWTLGGDRLTLAGGLGGGLIVLAALVAAEVQNRAEQNPPAASS